MATRQGLGVTNREDRVDILAAKMMAKDNPLMQRARAQGLQAANRRGLGNSSIAAGASTAATLEHVVPMASQNAGQAFQKNMSGQDYLQRDDLLKTDYGLRGDLSAQESRQRMTETEKEYGFRSDLSRQEFDQQGNLIRTEYGERGNLSRQESGQRKDEARTNAGLTQRQTILEGSIGRQNAEFQGGIDRQNMELEGQISRENARFTAQLEKSLKDMDLSAEAKRGAETMVNNAYNDYEDSLRSILSNPDLPAEERNNLITAAQGRVQSRMQLIEKIHGTTFNWPKGMFGGGGGSTSGGATGGKAGGGNAPRQSGGFRNPGRR